MILIVSKSGALSPSAIINPTTVSPKSGWGTPIIDGQQRLPPQYRFCLFPFGGWHGLQNERLEIRKKLANSSSRLPTNQWANLTTLGAPFCWLNSSKAKFINEDFRDPHSSSIPTTKPRERSICRNNEERWRAIFQKPAYHFLLF